MRLKNEKLVRRGLRREIKYSKNSNQSKTCILKIIGEDIHNASLLLQYVMSKNELDQSM